MVITFKVLSTICHCYKLHQSLNTPKVRKNQSKRHKIIKLDMTGTRNEFKHDLHPRIAAIWRRIAGSN